jgi:sarcosine oxidase
VGGRTGAADEPLDDAPGAITRERDEAPAPAGAGIVGHLPASVRSPQLAEPPRTAVEPTTRSTLPRDRPFHPGSAGCCQAGPVRTSHADLVIVGGGAMGLATAWAAAPRAAVVLVERFAPSHDRGASHGGERIWRHSYVDPAYVEMALAADDGWECLERAAGTPLRHRVGCVEHGEGAELDKLARTSAACGVATERLTAAEAARRWPGLAFASDVLAQPDAGWVRADEGLRLLRAGAEAAGADLRFGRAVTGLDVNDDGVRVTIEGGTPDGTADGTQRMAEVTAEDTTISAPVAVVAAGAWSGDLLGPLGLPLPPLTTTEEHVFFFERRPGVAPNDVPSFIHWGPTTRYGLPSADGRVKVGEHHTGTVTTGDDRTGRPDPQRAARMERYAREWLPGVVPQVVDTTTCLYTSTPTHDFVLDRVGPVVVGAGFSGHGFKFVPEVGRRLAAMALDGAPSRPPFTLAAHTTAADG